MSDGGRGRVLRRGVPVAIVVGVVIVGALFVRADIARAPAAPPDADQSASGGSTEDGARAPEVAFERFDGQAARLEDWAGEPVVLNFWASWCPPCVAEMRDAFEPLHQDLGDRVTFLGVNLQDTPEAAQDVVAQTGVTYELARDADGALFTAFGGFGMPTTALIDENGTMVARHSGALTRAELETLIRNHLLGP